MTRREKIEALREARADAQEALTDPAFLAHPTRATEARDMIRQCNEQIRRLETQEGGADSEAETATA